MQRRTAVGQLRPDIVMLDGHYKQGDKVAEVINRDQRASPDFLLVLGTSLKIRGLLDLVKGFARTVRSSGGRVVYVNLSAPSRHWEDLVDYWIASSCDA